MPVPFGKGDSPIFVDTKIGTVPHSRATSNGRLPPAARDETELSSLFPFRRAVTLIELLVVITIILILLVLVARRLKPAIESRRVREAARAIAVYISSARNMAMSTGRPCGILFSPTKLQQIEAPTPYTGEFTSATATVSWNQSAGTGGVFFNPAINPSLVSPGSSSSPSTTLGSGPYSSTAQARVTPSWESKPPRPQSNSIPK